ncbi:uncharacterized protein LOC128954382 [Oppia nitens]|uniref:uncharacterized protein LOC128954382 n=1 Tax=Oppia nitens TaxID=1686743 RepID=UPI0023DC79BF|nr:uncharacterized protein LOC128954382 [Oppia nitens]
MTTKTTTVMTPKDSFDRFGDDLAELLLQYLPIDDRLSLESVSKQWLTLIFTTETHLVFDRKLRERLFGKNSLINKKQTLNLFESIVKKCPNITTITIKDTHFTDDYFKLFNDNKYCSRLTHISLNHSSYLYHNSYGKSFDLFCQRFGQQLQTLKSNGIDITNKLFPKCMDSFRNLRTLDITIWEESLGLNVIFTDNKLYSLPKTMQSFTLRLDNNFIKLFTKFTTTYGQQIRSLTLLPDYLEDENNFNTLTVGLSQIQQLKQLSIILPNYFGTDQTIQLLITIGRRCRQLIEFSYTSKVSRIYLNQIFVSINEHMSPQLRRLSLGCCPIYDQQFPLTSGSLKRLHRLTHLTLRIYNQRIIVHHCFGTVGTPHGCLSSVRCKQTENK